MKIAFAAICKPDDNEALLLDQCLESIKDYVDSIYITQAGTEPNKAVSEVIKKYGGVESFWKWNNNFADARNYNFAQVPKDIDYIFWLDADDTLRSGEKLRETIETNAFADTFSLWYNYAFDEWGNPIVVHHKTRIVRNDGCVSWAGALHEDFATHRQINAQHIEGVEVIHNTSMNRIIAAKSRNVEVATQMVTDLPNDPRSYWNLAQSQFGAFQYEEAVKSFTKFLELSTSDDEKYIARMRKGEALYQLGKKTQGIDELRYAIGLKPDYPDAYIRLGEYLYSDNKFADAIGLLKQSLQLQPPYYKIVVFNPMDYKYTPLKWLAYSYIGIAQPMLAYECFKMMLELTPLDTKLGEITDLMKQQADQQEAMLAKYNEMKNMDKMEMLMALNDLPAEYKCAPMFINLRNVNFPKTTSTGKEIAFYCGFTEREWDADTVKQGIGGSEEAVIHLSQQFADAGYDVTVYNNCGHTEKKFGKVLYKPFYTFNYRDKHDTVIVWRTAKLLDYDINATRVFIDLHDVMPEGEFNEKRLAKVDKIFVKSQFHRELLPNVPDDKFVIIPNGIVYRDFEKKSKRDPMLIINTSSPDRSISSLIRIFKMVKEQVPEAKCEWAYGWNNFNDAYSNDPVKIQWRDAMIEGMKEAGIVDRGRVSHADVRDMYLNARIFLYPTEFAEIDCISLRKAQAGGAMPITTDFGALKTTGRHGVKIKSKKTKDNWCQNYQFDFGVDDEKMEDKFVDAVVAELKSGMLEDVEMRKDMAQFDWQKIGQLWCDHI